MTMGTDDFLHELAVEVEADIELDRAGTPPDDDADWVLDPYEAQVEAADLNNLQGAIEALETDSGSYPPAHD
ncbi:hypothetical protein EV651_109231 [Kribbella sp. VKM Ac-2571]|uniref:hypothetical protein n=1 Tax=Kribbella sp. VKM Ac-2571 TaxID=2512222 RepID=UPI00105FF890|nr:hypothetical protein [Kribbella sp. VKM Ac-2571]TDO58956.1 hypothetical protein EV651_109231 [Kribbella sp. VKM Ac-2571]